MDNIKDIYYKISDRIEEYGDPKKIIIIGVIGVIVLSYLIMLIGQLINPARALTGTPINYNPISLLVSLFMNPVWFLVFFLFFGGIIMVMVISRVYGERMKGGEIDPISNRKFSKDKHLGDAHFLKKNEIREFLDITPVDKIRGVPLGKYSKDVKDCVSIPVEPKGRDKTEQFKHKASNGNMLVYGGSGAGKTFNFVVPYLYKVIDRKESFISTDTKGEVFSEIYWYALKNNYEIKVFNCDEPDKGDSIHLLKIVGTDQERANLIANVLIRNSAEDIGKSVPFWENMLHQLLMSCMLYITYEYDEKYKLHLATIEQIQKEKISEEEKRQRIYDEELEWEKMNDPIHGYGTIGRMYDFINSRLYEYKNGEWYKPRENIITIKEGNEEKQKTIENQLDYIATKLKLAFMESNNHPSMASWKTFNSFPQQHKDNSLGTLATRLRIFQYDSVREAFGRDDIKIGMTGEKPSAIFAIIDPLEESKSIISAVFFTLATRTLLDIAKKKPTRRLKIDTHVVMDEYFSVGYLPGIEEEVSLCRSYGMNLIFILQGRTQLMNRHPKGYQTIESNCGTFLNLGLSTEENSLKFMEKMSGTTTVQTDMSGYSRSTLAPVEIIGDMNVRRGMSAQPLVTENDALHLPRDMALVIIPPNHTLRLYKLGKHEMPQYHEIKDCPPRNIYHYKNFKNKDKTYFKDVKQLPSPAWVTPTYNPSADPVGYNLNQAFGDKILDKVNPQKKNKDPLFERNKKSEQMNFFDNTNDLDNDENDAFDIIDDDWDDAVS